MASYPLQSESQSFSSFLTRPFKEYSLSTHRSPSALIPSSTFSLQKCSRLIPLSSGLSLYAPFLVSPELVIPRQHSRNPTFAFFCRKYYSLRAHVFYFFIFYVSSVPLESNLHASQDFHHFSSLLDPWCPQKCLSYGGGSLHQHPG